MVGCDCESDSLRLKKKLLLFFFSASGMSSSPLLSVLKQASPDADNERLSSWYKVLTTHGIHGAGDIKHLDDLTFDELLADPAVLQLGLPIKAALRKIRSGSIGGAAGGAAPAVASSTTTRADAAKGAVKVAMAGVAAVGDEQRSAVMSSVGGVISNRVLGAVTSAGSGVGDIAAQLAACHAALQVTLGIVNEVRRMYQQAKANREKCKELAALVDSLSLPLNEVNSLLVSGVVQAHRAGEISTRLESTQLAVTDAQSVIAEFVVIRNKKGFFVRVKEVLISGSLASAFERVCGDIEHSYSGLHRLLTILAAVDALKVVEANRPPKDALAKVAEANKRDLTTLHQDLVEVAGGEQALAAELRGVEWQLDALKSCIVDSLGRIESQLATIHRELIAMHAMMAQMTAGQQARAPAAQFANPDAAAFWNQHVARIASANDRIAWSNFSTTVFNILSTQGIDKASWIAIEPAVRARFDANRDGTISRAEYDEATSRPSPATVLEICFQLLLLHAKSDATSRRLNRAETVQSALVASRKQAEARSGPNYLPMTSRHAALVELVSAQFAGDEKAR